MMRITMMMKVKVVVIEDGLKEGNFGDNYECVHLHICVCVF